MSRPSFPSWANIFWKVLYHWQWSSNSAEPSEARIVATCGDRKKEGQRRNGPLGLWGLDCPHFRYRTPHKRLRSPSRLWFSQAGMTFVSLWNEWQVIFRSFAWIFEFSLSDAATTDGEHPVAGTSRCSRSSGLPHPVDFYDRWMATFW